MLVAGDDLIDWIADREMLLIAAWTSEIKAALGWEHAFAEALAAKLHKAMLTAMLTGRTENDFLKIVGGSNTGLPLRDEKAVADRFYNVTLKLARAASRHIRDNASTIMVFKRGVVVGDGRTDPAHLPLAQVLLPRRHAFWTRWQPAFGMECRCSTTLMTQRDFDRSGRAITSDTDLAWLEDRLHDSWPAEFHPLLDFRQSLEPVIEPKSQIRLTPEQLAEVLSAFK
jgi:hypothetical protein